MEYRRGRSNQVPAVLKPPPAPQKPAKYRNQPVAEGGVRFDSKSELKRYKTLKALEIAGRISDLDRQVAFPLKIVGPFGAMEIEYIADFCYRQDGALVVEDVKSPATSKDKVYVLKKRLMQVMHGISITEVGGRGKGRGGGN